MRTREETHRENPTVRQVCDYCRQGTCETHQKVWSTVHDSTYVYSIQLF
jgi:uncharacterized UBP type Zn finger protein